MRVLHVTECFGGGVSRAVSQWASEFADDDHLLLWEGDDAPAAELFRVREPLPASLPRRVMAVRRAVERYGVDTVVAHSSWAGLYARLVSLPVPVVYVPHALKTLDRSTAAPLRALYWLVEFFLQPRTAAFGVLSPEEEFAVDRLGGGSRVHRIVNRPSIQPALVNSAPPTNCVAMVGRVAPQKSPEYFIDFVRHVRRMDPSISAVWIGDGDPALVRDLEGAGVEVTGWLQGDDMARALARPFLYVHTAAYEGFPISILDALAAGRVAIARALPALSDTLIPQRDEPLELARLALSILHGEPSATELAARAREALLFSVSSDAYRRAILTLVEHSIKEHA